MSSRISKVLLRYNYIEENINEQYRIIGSFFGLSESAFNILYALNQEGNGCAQSVLYKNSGMSRKTAGSSLHKLESEGILRIEKDEKKRANHVFLTEKGQQIVNERIVPIMEAENSVFDSWDPEDQETFLRLSNRYLDELSEAFRRIRDLVPRQGP